MASKYTLRQSKKYSKETLLDKLTLKPVITKALGDIKNKTILDVGCGSGRHCVLMAKKGATVIGIDASKNQITLARQINSHPRIKYLVGDCANIPQVKNSSVDKALMNMVTPDLSSKNKLSKIIQTVHRVLKPNGELVLSGLHPLFIIPDPTLDCTISFNKKNYFNEGHNYNSRVRLTNGETILFRETHFSLSYLSKVLLKNGLLIKQILESKQQPIFGIFLPKFIVLIAEKRK